MPGLLSLCCGKADDTARKRFLADIQRKAAVAQADVAKIKGFDKVYERLQYWKRAPGEDVRDGASSERRTLSLEALHAAFPVAKDGGTQYLTFEIDGGGFNNIRMSMEIAAAFAAHRCPPDRSIGADRLRAIAGHWQSCAGWRASRASRQRKSAR